MGIYDRDYYRDERRGFFFGPDQPMVIKLIIINVAIWVIDLFTQTKDSYWLSEIAMALYDNTPAHPLQWYRIITYGFAHAPGEPWHILFNMLVLYFFGRDIEFRYGRYEFLRFYLVGIVVSGLVWLVEMHLRGISPARAVGASGAISAVVILYVFNFPNRTILLMGILPVPAYVIGIGYVLADMAGLVHQLDQVAYSAHLGGAAFGAMYYQFRWNLSFLQPRWLSFGAMGRSLSRMNQPKLKVHNPDDGDDEDDLSNQVDEILAKIKREGEGSLTGKERRILERASKRYKSRRED